MAVNYPGTTESTQNNGFLVGSAGPWTIMAWLKLHATTDTNRYLFETMGSSSNDTNQLALIYGFVANKYELFASSAGGVRTGSDLAPGDTGWHHVAWRKQSSGSSSYDKFLDGVKTQINAAISFTMPTPMTFSTLGGARGSAAETNFSMFRFFILQQALSDANIAAEAAGTYGGPSFSASDSYWSFASTNGTDNSGNGRDWGGAGAGVTLVSNPSVFSSVPASILIANYRRLRL